MRGNAVSGLLAAHACASAERAPIKLCFIVTGLSVGGAELILLRLISKLNRDEFAPSLISLASDGPLVDRFRRLGIEVHSVEIPESRWSLSGLGRLVRLIRKLDPDLIQGWMYHANLAAQIAKTAGRLRAPVVWNIRGIHTDLRNERFSTAATIWLGARLSYLAKIVINNSHVSVAAHRQHLGYSESNVVVIPNGFDTEEYRPSSDARARLRATLGLTSDARVVGHVARLHPMKDHIALLRAAALLLRHEDNVHFVLMGEGVDSSSQLSSLAEALGIRSHVHFLGRQESVAPLLPGCDLVTLTSAYGEAFPNALGEAMACGVPCVTTNVGDSAHIVGSTGAVVQPKDIAGLARHWREFLDLPVDVLAERGRQARDRILKEFSVESMVSRYEALYRDVAGSQKQAKH